MKCHNGNEKQEVHCLIEHVCSILTRSKARRISRRCTRCLEPATCRSCCSTSREQGTGRGGHNLLRGSGEAPGPDLRLCGSHLCSSTTGN
ncbi:LOB domain-containing protein 18 [Phtheirospermum japonicum]|uniref:LOB domain-containing protein 18 n=1 Tax=Phtheirospermum japonicum TaxID=374723 RepID=A0A830DL90_9LAMI|nr:LOB domain-containing protein 18 [Phtheirospermum japonicum]